MTKEEPCKKEVFVINDRDYGPKYVVEATPEEFKKAREELSAWQKNWDQSLEWSRYEPLTQEEFVEQFKKDHADDWD